MPDAGTWGLLLALAGVVVLWLFVAHEAHIDEPILRPALFVDRAFSLLNLMSVAVSLVGFAVLLLVPYQLTRIAGLSASAGGVVLAINALGMIAGSWAAGRLAGKLRQRAIALAGVLLVVAGSAAIGSFAAAATLYPMIAALFCQGVGLGLFQVAYTDIVTETLPLRDRGVAGSLAMVSRTLGTVAGATLLSALFQHGRQAALAEGVGDGAAFIRGFETTFLGAAAALAIVLLLSFLHRRLWLD
jgi:MFS family permease